MMKLLKFRQTHRFNKYTFLWAAALGIAVYLSFQWFVDKNYIGIVERKSHALGPQEPGIIRTMLVKEGDSVRKDQVLAVLDVSDLSAFLGNLQKEFAKIQGLETAQKSRSAVEVQRLKLQAENEASDLLERISLIESKSSELAALNAQIDRFVNADKAGLGTSRDLPDWMIRRDALEAFLSRQRNEMARLSEQAKDIQRSNNRLTDANLDSMTQSLLTEQMKHAEELQRDIVVTEEHIRRRTLVSPCDGVVTDLNAGPGDAVKDFDSVILIEEKNPRYLTVYLPEKTSIRPVPGMKANIYSSRGRKYNTSGTVSFVHPGISRATERISFRGHVFWARKVQVELDSTHALLPGEVVNVRIEKQTRRDFQNPASGQDR